MYLWDSQKSVFGVSCFERFSKANVQNRACVTSVGYDECKFIFEVPDVQQINLRIMKIEDERGLKIVQLRLKVNKEVASLMIQL